MLRSILLAGALAATPFAATAAPWTLDKSHAHITFTVNHLGFSTTNGAFREFDMEIDFDPENIGATSVVATINAASIDTFFGKRDEHIRSPDFLNVESHPTITFATTTVTQTGDNTADVMGDLTILGNTLPVTFQAELVQLGPSPFNPEVTVAGMRVSGEIDRTAFGMETYAPAIGAVIPVTIDFEMSPAQ